VRAEVPYREQRHHLRVRPHRLLHCHEPSRAPAGGSADQGTSSRALLTSDFAIGPGCSALHDAPATNAQARAAGAVEGDRCSGGCPGFPVPDSLDRLLFPGLRSAHSCAALAARPKPRRTLPFAMSVALGSKPRAAAAESRTVSAPSSARSAGNGSRPRIGGTPPARPRYRIAQTCPPLSTARRRS